MRSVVSGRVVYLSRGKPLNPDWVDFSTVRSLSPAMRCSVAPSRTRTAVRTSWPLRTKEWSCPVAVGLDPVPAVGLGRPAAAGDPVEARGEVLAQPQQEGFRGADAVPGEGVDGVLLGVRGHHVAVVAFEVGRGEVPAQLRGDVQVFDLVAVGVPGDLDDPDFGFSVLVVAEDDLVAHGLIPNFRYVEPKSHIEIKRVFPARFLFRRPNKKEPTSVDASSLRPCLLLPGYVTCATNWD